MEKYCHANLAYVLNKPKSIGVLKAKPEDFFVKEKINFELTGEGEHEWVFLEKINQNTQDVIALLAKKTNTPVKNIGHSGLKDKNAVTQQWLSFHRPGMPNIDWQAIDIGTIKILKIKKHNKKLKIGTHQNNEFVILINLEKINADDIKTKIDQIVKNGFVNYFGEQRFGNNGNNVVKARKWLDKQFKLSKAKKSLYISTLRSEFFNLALSNRVAANKWAKVIDGDYLMLNNSQSFFLYNSVEKETIKKRLLDKDLSISHNLLGCLAKGTFNQFETSVLENGFASVLNLFALQKIQAQKRAIRAEVKKLSYSLNENQKTLELKFSLNKGQYATSLIREIVAIRNSLILT